MLPLPRPIEYLSDEVLRSCTLDHVEDDAGDLRWRQRVRVSRRVDAELVHMELSAAGGARQTYHKPTRVFPNELGPNPVTFVELGYSRCQGGPELFFGLCQTSYTLSRQPRFVDCYYLSLFLH